MSQPFNDIKVIDLTHVLAGPFATYQFALLGADVIKVENPINPDCARGRGGNTTQNSKMLGMNYQVQGGNKRAISIDLKTKQGQTIFKKLIKQADILVENYRASALDELGLSYESLSAINPKLIYCSITGFGATGSKAKINAYDNVIQASSGIVSQSGGHKPGVSFVDYATGLEAAFAISAALFRAERTGMGAHISVSMYETALLMMAPEAAREKNQHNNPNHLEAGIKTYPTQQGELCLGAFTPQQMSKCLKALVQDGYCNIKIPTLNEWDELWKAGESLHAELQDIFLQNTADFWQEYMHNIGLPAEKLRHLAEAVNDQQLDAREFFKKVTIDGKPQYIPTSAYKFDDEGGVKLTRSAPQISQHADEILQEIEIRPEEINALRKSGVIL
ncbi:MAG: CoA transferase [Alphaproteobacteria bacterium]|nr:CoA transferase [Alphaproteobacteria bacterium]